MPQISLWDAPSWAPRGSTGIFGVTLSAAPPATMTVTVDFTSGTSGVLVTSGGTLTFTLADWSRAQEVTITADSYKPQGVRDHSAGLSPAAECRSRCPSGRPASWGVLPRRGGLPTPVSRAAPS